MRSLRWRLVIGALLWTAGLVVVTNLIITGLVQRRFSNYWIHRGAMAMFAFGLLAVGLTQVRVGMKALSQLRARLLAVREGRERRVEGRFPTEVAPLVDDLNALLADREERVARARAKAGDLAHGLKTPLAVLAQEAERARRSGHEELAGTIEQQVERMRRQVEHHLAQARAAAAAGGDPAIRCSVIASVEGLVRTLHRLHAERGLEIEVRVAPEHVVRCQREDLDEMLGNLLDNACKWARSRVVVASARNGARMVITIDDDGAGLDPSLHDRVLQRGVRADQAAPGSGLGLAIVRDLAELYGGDIRLEGSPAGGIRATLRLASS